MTVVSVVIPTKDRVPYLKECIGNLLSQTHPIDELIIIDGSSSGETEAFVKKLKTTFRVVYIRQTEGGTARARNLGVEAASGDVIIFVDDDVVLDERYVEEVLKVLDRWKRVGGVAGMLIVENGGGRSPLRLLDKLYNVLFLKGSWRHGVVLPSGFPTRFPNIPTFVQHLDTSNAAFRRDVFKEFKFDERLEELSRYAMWEALDFSYSVSKKYLLFINPRAKAIHRPASTSRIDYMEYMRVYLYNLHYIVKKHNLNTLAFWWAVFGLLLRHVARGFLWKEDRLRARGLVEGIREIIRRR